jgi:aryl-alcohol dehydrogenase-like predicted oxidoreductase
VLTGKYQGGAWPAGARFTKYKDMPARQAPMARRFVNEKTLASTGRWIGLAQELGMSVTTFATAWSKQHDFVASTIAGATHEDHLPDIFAAADVTLPEDMMKKIDEISKEIRYPMG